ncbi:MAG: formylglycine-generating enzyme family protein [Anaerolineae bacterium]|nr:formylglycine-generating enzyme family protein [Anaerolineae bacterium]
MDAQFGFSTPTRMITIEQRDLLRTMRNLTTPPPERFKAAFRMAKLGDPRPGVGLRRYRGEDLPDIDWVEVPGGEFVYQEGQRYTALPTYFIARYPITVAQFTPFVQGDGYRNPAYWTRAGWDWLEGRQHPQLWEAPKWHIPNHPVVGISWYEAHAYCCWLATHLGFDADVVRLPSEWEWEKAARGTDGRLYPWGSNRAQEGDANINEDYAYYHVGRYFMKRTSAVGIYPRDVSPYGVADLSGNVREWCLTSFHDIGRVVRGGGWFSNSHQAQATHRNWFYPSNCDHSIGLRVVAAVLPHHYYSLYGRN